MTIIGIINLHVAECQINDCPCKDEIDLYDINSHQFLQKEFIKQAPHLSEIFVNNLIRKFYEESTLKFVNSP
jgi:hypothetical protein